MHRDTISVLPIPGMEQNICIDLLPVKTSSVRCRTRSRACQVAFNSIFLNVDLGMEGYPTKITATAAKGIVSSLCRHFHEAVPRKALSDSAISEVLGLILGKSAQQRVVSSDG